MACLKTHPLGRNVLEDFWCRSGRGSGRAYLHQPLGRWIAARIGILGQDRHSEMRRWVPVRRKRCMGNRLDVRIDKEKMCQSGYPCLMTRRKERNPVNRKTIFGCDHLQLCLPVTLPRLHLTFVPSRPAKCRPSYPPRPQRLGNPHGIALSKLWHFPDAMRPGQYLRTRPSTAPRKRHSLSVAHSQH